MESSDSERVNAMFKKYFLVIMVLLSFPLASFAGKVGTTAPDFSLEDLNGNKVRLEQFKGKVVFLVFWGTWCAPCREELPELDKLYTNYRKQGFEVIGVSVNASRSDVTKFLQKIPVGFQILLDKKDEAGDAYRVSSLPIGYLIGKDGTIRHQHMGFGPEFIPEYEKEIQELLKQ
jgi:peroxiredoxin